ncbi:hypothetical protein C810_02392, partial [Lachnospiraceae bacterium A2]
MLEALSYLLRIGDYGRFAGKGTGNNVYMDIKGRKPAFKRTRSFIDRNTLFSTIRRYGKKIKPDFDGHTYLETVQCFFKLPEGEQDKYRVTYDGQETFAFPMSDKYILGLYTHCISARRAASADMFKKMNSIYNFKTGCVKTECLHEGWQTSGSLKVVRMAYNLYCNGTPSVLDYDDAEEQVDECR